MDKEAVLDGKVFFRGVRELLIRDCWRVLSRKRILEENRYARRGEVEKMLKLFKNDFFVAWGQHFQILAPTVKSKAARPFSSGLISNYSVLKWGPLEKIATAKDGAGCFIVQNSWVKILYKVWGCTISQKGTQEKSFGRHTATALARKKGGERAVPKFEPFSKFPGITFSYFFTCTTIAKNMTHSDTFFTIIDQVTGSYPIYS